MTKPKTQLDAELLTTLVEELRDRLKQAEADVALLQRLKDAEATALKVRADLAVAMTSLAEAMADKLSAERKGRYGNFKDIRVDVGFDKSGLSQSALAASYTITVTRMTYDYGMHESVWAESVSTSFDALPADAWGYLMEVRPDAIPNLIQNLAPGDPPEAMRLYFQGMKRGYLTA